MHVYMCLCGVYILYITYTLRILCWFDSVCPAVTKEEKTEEKTSFLEAEAGRLRWCNNGPYYRLHPHGWQSLIISTAPHTKSWKVKCFLTCKLLSWKSVADHCSLFDDICITGQVSLSHHVTPVLSFFLFYPSFPFRMYQHALLVSFLHHFKLILLILY